MVRKIVALGVLALFLCISAASGEGQVGPIVVLNAVTTSTPGTPIATGNYYDCAVRAVAATTSSATVLISGSDTRNGTYDPLASFVNPSATATLDLPQYFHGACPAFLLVSTTSHTSGTITATVTMSGRK